MLATLANACSLTAYLACSLVMAQNLTIPSDIWRKPSLNLSRQAIESFAYEAAEPISRQQLSIGQPGLPFLNDVTSAFAALATSDYYSNNKTWANIGSDVLQNYIQSNGFWHDSSDKATSDVNYWGLALFYSYRAYKEQSLLENALDAWNLTYVNAFVTPAAAANGSGAGRNVSLFPPAACSSNGTFAGGVFFREDDQSNIYLNSVSTGPFIALSAYLFEETQSVVYKDAAQLSLDFIIHHLWNGTIVYDGMYLDSCEPHTEAWTLNQAWVIEGLAVLANVTQNATLTNFLETMVSSIATFSGWSYSDGILNDAAHDSSLTGPDQALKGVLIRALAEARIRNPGTDLARYIEAYISVQLNSIQDYAQAPAGNDTVYSRSWNGPAPTSFDIGGNTAALDVLNAAISFAVPSIGSETSPSNHSSSSHAHVGVIAGSIVGAIVAGVVAIGIVLWRCRRRHADPAQIIEVSAISRRDAIDPFIMRAALSSTGSSKWGRAISEAGNTSGLSPPISDSHPGNILDMDRVQGPDEESIQVAEIPSLIQRLNNFLQGRDAPPLYSAE